VASPQVHPTALVDRSAELEAGVAVGPFAVIGARVRIGEGTHLGPHVVVEPDVTVGRENVLGAGVVLGCRPQHRGYRGERSSVRVGDRNIFGEYATVSRGYGEDTVTEIGDDGYIMSYVRVDHNCRIGSRVTITSGAGLGGFVAVDDQAYVGGNSGIHQFVRVGRLGMVGAVSIVRQDVPPYVLVAGVPARAHALNVVGLGRAGVAAAHRRALRQAFTVLFRSGLTVSGALKRLEGDLAADPFVAEVIAFIKSGRGERGIVRWAGETSSD
jgi:UDP-N-acetylglucosamine acyltransferase